MITNVGWGTMSKFVLDKDGGIQSLRSVSFHKKGWIESHFGLALPRAEPGRLFVICTGGVVSSVEKCELETATKF